MTTPISDAFTSDAEINAFRSEESGLDLMGYVDDIDGIRILRTAHGQVFKFVLNNHGTVRMRVLIWGPKLARRWEEEIKMGSVVEILGGAVKTSNVRFRDADVHLLEFHVQPHSEIILHGFFDPRGAVVPVPVRLIELRDVMVEEGRVEIECYIRTPLRPVQYNHAASGQAMVTDGVYRLGINIAAYVPNELLIIGTAVTIRGQMNRGPNAFFIIDSMEDIMIRDGVRPMPRDQLRAGFNPVPQVRLARLEHQGANDIRPNIADRGINEGEVGNVVNQEPIVNPLAAGVVVNQGVGDINNGLIVDINIAEGQNVVANIVNDEPVVIVGDDGDENVANRGEIGGDNVDGEPIVIADEADEVNGQ